MIIFISIPWFSPAYKAGGPIQSIVNLVQNFDENISYKIYCGNTDLDGKLLEDIKFDTWNYFSNNTQVYYTSTQNSKDLKREIEFIKPNVFFIIGMFSWHFNILPIFFNFKDKKILSVRGMLHPGALTQKSLKKKVFISVLKTFGIQKKINFHATDEIEAGYIKNIFGHNSKVYLANNFGKIFESKNAIVKLPHELKLITVALISPMKNHLLVLQSLKNCNLKIDYTICGPIKDQAYWQLCLTEINNLPSNISVNYKGEILHTFIEKELSENHVFIMPSKSENFGHAISEALSCGMPVITSNFTPWNDLDKAKAGINVDNDIVSIQKAISFFADMNQEMFNSYKKSTLHYFLIKNDVGQKKQSYKKMFAH